MRSAAVDSPTTTVIERIEQEAARRPGAMAIRADGLDLDYAALNARANRLSNWLIAQGIGPEDIVAVVLPRGVDLWPALLALLRTGGACLPLDPDYPSRHLSQAIDDVRPAIVIANGEALPALPQD